MQRTLNRVYQRIQGNHPRRPPSLPGRAMELLCDVLLVLAVSAVLAGVILVVASLIDGLPLLRLGLGLASLALGPALLLLWERLAWAPFAKRLSELT